MKRKIAYILIAMLSLQLFAGCGAKEDAGKNSSEAKSTKEADTSGSSQEAESTASQEQNGEIIYPIQGENLTLSLATAEVANVTVTCPWVDTPFVKAYEEATGVTLEVTHPSDFALTFASEKLPDIIYYDFNRYPGGPDQAVKDGVILAVEDLIPTYAPDYYKVLSSNEDWLKGATTAEGHLVGTNFIRTSQVLCTSAGAMARKDWLDDLGLEVPKTPEEFKNVLIAFRDQKKATVPFSTTYYNVRARGLEDGSLTTPFGLVKADFYQKDGKVYYGYYSQELKDVLTWLHELYAEKLLDPDFATIDNNTNNSNFMNGLSGVTMGSIGSGMGTYLTTMAETNPDFDVTGIPSLVAKEGDRAYSAHMVSPITGTVAAISADCENVELALQFLNYAWTQEGDLLCNYGTEGVSYEMVDDQPTYTDLITKNPDGLTMVQALVQYSNEGQASGIAYGQAEGYIWQYYSNERQQEALRMWTDCDAAKYRMPNLTVSDPEKLAEINSEVSTYINETILAFINGSKSLDEYDDYLNTLKSMGVEDVIEMYQEALDRYNAD